MVAPAFEGIDLFKIAGRSISGWIPSLKTGTTSHVRHANQLQNTAETVGDQVQTAKTPKCTFFGVVPIEPKRILDSGIALVECPDCARTRTLSSRHGVLRFPAHSKRKTRTPVTSQRWAMEQTIWEVVGGERT
jgi:hypothetical protein